MPSNPQVPREVAEAKGKGRGRLVGLGIALVVIGFAAILTLAGVVFSTLSQAKEPRATAEGESRELTLPCGEGGYYRLQTLPKYLNVTLPAQYCWTQWLTFPEPIRGQWRVQYSEPITDEFTLEDNTTTIYRESKPTDNNPLRKNPTGVRFANSNGHPIRVVIWFDEESRRARGLLPESSVMPSVVTTAPPKAPSSPAEVYSPPQTTAIPGDIFGLFARKDSGDPRLIEGTVTAIAEEGGNRAITIASDDDGKYYTVWGDDSKNIVSAYVSGTGRLSEVKVGDRLLVQVDSVDRYRPAIEYVRYGRKKRG